MALASVAWLFGALSHNQTVAGLIPSQGTCLGCGFDLCLVQVRVIPSMNTEGNR